MTPKDAAKINKENKPADWQAQDKKTLKRINGGLQGKCSHRINGKDRLIYHMEGGQLYIAHGKGHYGDQ